MMRFGQGLEFSMLSILNHCQIVVIVLNITWKIPCSMDYTQM